MITWTSPDGTFRREDAAHTILVATARDGALPRSTRARRGSGSFRKRLHAKHARVRGALVRIFREARRDQRIELRPDHHDRHRRPLATALLHIDVLVQQLLLGLVAR